MSEALGPDLFSVKVAFELSGIHDFNPVVSRSKRWKRWFTNFGLRTCEYCKDKNGTLYEEKDVPKNEPPAHPNCKCYIDFIRAILAGTASIEGMDGADYTLFQHGTLPGHYVTKDDAKLAGWIKKEGNLREVLPGASIGGDSYKNKDGKLPSSPRRLWFEADMNYLGGFRSTPAHRVLYSNDGLVFVTYDHYKTFFEIN